MQDALAAPCHLQVERGPAAGIVLPLNHSYCRLGRAQLADETVSREHVLFINKSGKIWVRDLGSSNGTFRGRVVSPFTRLRFQQELGASSRIRAGNTVLKVAKRPRVLTVALPRPQLNTASWRQWLFLPMFLFLPLSLASVLQIPRTWAGIILGVCLLIALGVWFYRRPRPVSPAQLLLTATQSSCPNAPPFASNPNQQVGAWVSPHQVVRAHSGDKLCFTGRYARERAFWWAGQIAWQEESKYRLGFLNSSAPHRPPESINPEDAHAKCDRVIVVPPDRTPLSSAGDICVTWANSPGEAPVWTNRIVPVSKGSRATFNADLPSSIWWQFMVSTTNTAASTQLPQQVPFSCLWQEVLEAENPIAKIKNTWNRSDSLRAPVAKDASEIVYLDLIKDGPHALLAGTTGSGKSAALTTWLISMALAHPPSKLQYVLIDYKGGDAFKKLQALPHVLGILTDLEPSLTRRALLSLNAEIKYREQHKTLSHPRIVVVVDEFRVLATDHPDLLDSLIRLATLGRSLGIHLVLATQRPAGIVDGQIKSNMALRVCLRVLETADSCDILGDGRSAQLPAIAGRAWIKSAREAAGKLLQFAWISEATQIETITHLCRLSWKPTYPPRIPWAPPLPQKISLSELPPVSKGATLGLGDYPSLQSTAPLTVSLPFSLHLVGSKDSGRTSLALMLALQLANAGEEVHVICPSIREFFGSSFRTISRASWPGTIATSPQVSLETLQRACRGQLSGTLIIDDCEDVLDSLERTYGVLSGHDLLSRLCRQSEALGISLLVVSEASQASSRLFGGLKTQIVGRIRDHIQVAQAGFTPQVLEHIGGAGVFVFSPSAQCTPFRAASPPPAQPAHFLPSPRASLCALPKHFTIPTSNDDSSSPAVFATGLSGDLQLEPADLERDWLIIGEAKSGKTNAARLLSHFMPHHLVLEGLSSNDSRLDQLPTEKRVEETYFAQTGQPLSGEDAPSNERIGRRHLIATVSPQIVQTSFSTSLADLRQRSILLILGDGRVCRPFVKDLDSQALPDSLSPIPGRGILVKNGKGIAIQTAIF